MWIVDLDVAFSGIGQVLGRVEAGGAKAAAMRRLKPFDHAVSSGGPGRGQAMFEWSLPPRHSGGEYRNPVLGMAETLGIEITRLHNHAT